MASNSISRGGRSLCHPQSQQSQSQSQAADGGAGAAPAHERTPVLVGPAYQLPESALPHPLTNDLKVLDRAVALAPPRVGARLFLPLGDPMCRWKPPPMPLRPAGRVAVAAAAAAAGPGGGAEGTGEGNGGGEGGAATAAVVSTEAVAAYVGKFPGMEEQALWVLYQAGWGLSLAERRLREYLKASNSEPPRDLDERGEEIPPLERFSPQDEVAFAELMRQHFKGFRHAAQHLGKSTKACVAFYYNTYKRKYQNQYLPLKLAARERRAREDEER